MNKIVIAALSILLLTGYAIGGLALTHDDIANTSFRPLADSTEGGWVTLTDKQAALPEHLVKVAER